MTDSESALAHWSHLFFEKCVAMREVWENPICLHTAAKILIILGPFFTIENVVSILAKA